MKRKRILSGVVVLISTLLPLQSDEWRDAARGQREKADRLRERGLRVCRQYAFLELALTSGEDYELLFTISPESLGQVEQALKVCGCHCYIIGKCFSGAESGHIEWSGTNRDFRGFRHF